MSKKSKYTALAVSAGLLIPGAAALAGSAEAAPGSEPVVLARHNGQTMYTVASVNVRQSPATEGRVLYSLAAGTKVSVTSRRTVVTRQYGRSRGRTQSVEWSQLSGGGWVQSSQLTAARPSWTTVTPTTAAPTTVAPTTPASTTVASVQVVTLKATNLLGGPGTAYKVVRAVPAGQPLTVVEVGWGWSSDLNATVKWNRVSEGGWVRADQVATTAKQASDTSTGQRVYVLKAANLRSGPGSTNPVVREVAAGQRLTVVEDGWGWSSDLNATVKWNKVSEGGWIRADLVAGL